MEPLPAVAFAVRMVLLPEQTYVAPVIETVGAAFTVTTVGADVAEQPFEFETDTV